MRIPSVLAAVAVLAILAGPAGASDSSVDFPSTPVFILVPIAATEAPPATALTVAPPPPAASGALPAPAVKALPASRPEDLVRIVVSLKAGEAPAVTEAKGVCPAAPTCDVFGVTDYRWKTDGDGTAVIPFKYNDTDRRPLRSPEAADVLAALHRAMDTWHHWDSNIVFRDDGDTTAEFAAPGRDGSCADGTNVVTWGRVDDPDAVGEAAMCLDRTRHVIRDADLELNISFWWANGTDPRRGVYDVQSIFTHELGHWLSLQDMYSGGAARQTMFGSADTNETRKRTPGLGDITGLQKAYPCGRGDSCPRTGIVTD